MKKLNIYYIVSILTLVFMMFMLYRTLQVTGWFEERREKTPSERIATAYTGEYQFLGEGSQDYLINVGVKPIGDGSSFTVQVDSTSEFLVTLSDFEDEQVLIEIYELDSLGSHHRMNGCELLLVEDSLGGFIGSTIGDFCGLDEGYSEYLAMEVLLSRQEVSLEIRRHLLGKTDSTSTMKYLFERID